MKKRIVSIVIAMCCIGPLMSGTANIAGRTYASSETASGAGETASYSYKTTAEKLDEKSSGGYKVVRRQNGTLDLSFAYNASPKKSASSTRKSKTNADANASQISDASESETGIDDNTQTTAAEQVSDGNSAGQGDQSDAQADLNSTAQNSDTDSAAQTASSQTVVKKQSVPKCVKQIIRFNADVDADLDYDAISKAYEPSNHGKYLTRVVTAQRPADENLADITDSDTVAEITNISR